MAASGLSCGMWDLCCGTPAPERVGSVVCSTRAVSLRLVSSVVVVHWLNCPVACGILVPRPGIEPTSPALEGGFFTTGPPGKSQFPVFEPHLLLSLPLCVFPCKTGFLLPGEGLQQFPFFSNHVFLLPSNCHNSLLNECA